MDTVVLSCPKSDCISRAEENICLVWLYSPLKHECLPQIRSHHLCSCHKTLCISLGKLLLTQITESR